MRGLTLIVATADPARLRSALGLAAAQAALGGAARLFLDADAVRLLAPAADDAAWHAAGLPGQAELIATALDLGVRILVCQSGLALAGLDFAALDSRIEAGGVTGLLATLACDERLLAL